MTHTLTTSRTAEAVESIDTLTYPLEFAMDPIECDGRYQPGDSVILTSKDGDVFLAHVQDVEEDRLRIYIEVD
jgi:hypothetical protein